MDEYILAFKPAISHFGRHDPSAVIFRDGTIEFGIEEERLTRQKHAVDTFPKNAIEACLKYCDVQLGDVDRILLPYIPKLQNKLFTYDVRKSIEHQDNSTFQRIVLPVIHTKRHVTARLFPLKEVRSRLEEIETPVPPIETRGHHACHAASAFHPSGFSEGLVLTVDGRGEYDSTVVWEGSETGIDRIETYEYPNSLGHLFSIVTEYLGYRAFNGEGKVMGLAPYGSQNDDIERKLRSRLDTSAAYDVTEITKGGIDAGVSWLEKLFDRPRNETVGSFDQWEKDFAYTAQKLLEEIVTAIVRQYLPQMGSNNVALAGGVHLNCKLNKRVMEIDRTDEVYIQPVAHDGGLAIGAGMLEFAPAHVERPSIYLGPRYSNDTIEETLKTNKLDYTKPADPIRYTAERLADGELVGWVQGRLEIGPRALGNRSILADPRTKESLDRVNEFVKHREKWRPFAPSMLEEAMDDYLVDAEPSPYMIKTFETREERRDEIEAVIHPADTTTRPQTVREDQNERYYQLISEFADITGVPVVLNTSFNDNGEPIVTTPVEAIKDFYGMGLDVLVLGDYVLEKPQGD